MDGKQTTEESTTPTSSGKEYAAYFVSPHPNGGWQVKRAKALKALKIFKTKAEAEQYAKNQGINYLTIGSEAKESRNLGIYLHFGYTEFITSFIEDGDLVLFYGKSI